MDKFGGYSLSLGREALQRADWESAIRLLLASLEEDPERFETYRWLQQAYEGAHREFGDPELLQMARRVCLGAKRQRLSGEQRAEIELEQARIERALDALELDYEPITREPHEHGPGHEH